MGIIGNASLQRFCCFPDGGAFGGRESARFEAGGSDNKYITRTAERLTDETHFATNRPLIEAEGVFGHRRSRAIEVGTVKDTHRDARSETRGVELERECEPKFLIYLCYL